MRHYAIRANGAKRTVVVSAAMGIAVATGLCATRQAAGQAAVNNFWPTADVPLGSLDRIGVKEIHTGPATGNPVAGQPQFTDTNVLHTTLMNQNPTAAEAARWRVSTYEAPVLNLLNTGGAGNFTGDTAFGVTRSATNPHLINGTPSVASGDLEDIGLVARGSIHVPAAGVYTFGVNSDDGFTLAFPLQNGGYRTWDGVNTANVTALVSYNGTANGAMAAGNRGATDSLGRITLPAGDHPFILTFNERGGGSAVELFSARGDKTSGFAGGGFKLLGQGPFADVLGRRYIGTVQAAAGQPANKAGWNVIEMISPGGTVDAGTTTAATAAQQPTASLANTIATYQQIRAANSPPPAGVAVVTAGVPANYTGGPTPPFDPNPKGIVYGYNTVERGSGDRTLNLVDFEPNTGQVRGVTRGTAANLEINRQAQGENNHFGIGARATLSIDTTSIYTFDVLADDDFRFRVLNSAGVPVPIIASNGSSTPGGGTAVTTANVDTPSDAGATDGTPDAYQTASGRGSDAFGRYNLTAGQIYTLEVVMHSDTGGASVGVFGLIGDWNAFNPGFQLVGQNDNIPNFTIVEGAPQYVARTEPVTWRGATGAWLTGSNWTYSQEPTATQDAIFPSPIPAGGATITLPGARTVKSLTIAAGYTFTGGSLTVDGPVSIAGGQTATFNTNLTTNSIQGGGNIAIGANTTTIRTKATGGGNSTVGGLTIAAGGKLDLNNNDVQINNTAANVLTDVAAQVRSGYNNGTWTGNGITSSTLATAYAANDRSRSLGYASNATGTLVKYTFTGDANLDAAVNGSDFALLAGNFGRPGLWQQGDFNYDGSVNGSDFALLAGNFGRQGSPSLEAAVTMSDWMALEAFGQSIGVPVPEPTAAGLLALGGLGLLARRRRRA